MSEQDNQPAPVPTEAVGGDGLRETGASAGEALEKFFKTHHFMPAVLRPLKGDALAEWKASKEAR